MKKSKIIALLMATACAASVFAACGEDECTKHVDTDKNGYCDSCEQAVIVITEQLPAEKEEEVDMVVNALPATKDLAGYVGPKAEDVEAALPANATVIEAFEGKTIGVQKGSLYQLIWEEEIVETVEGVEETFYKKHTEIYDVATGKTIYSFVSEKYEEGYSAHDTVEVKFYDCFVRINENRWVEEGSFYQANGKLLTLSGEAFAETESWINNGDVNSTYTGDRDYYYVTFNGMVYSFDGKTKSLVTLEGATAAESQHIQRPDFSEVAGNYGYVMDGDKVWIYDLTKWISCVYHNVMPSYWNNAQALVLDNGKLLVQYEKLLPDSAVNYDILNGGKKYDLVQTIINPADGSMTNVEFGYKMRTESYFITTDYNDNAKNVVYLYPITDKEVDYSAGFEAVIDSNLNILYANKPIIVGQEGTVEYLKDNKYGVLVSYGDETVRVLVDGAGKEIGKVPTNMELVAGFGRIGTKYYNYDLEEVFDANDYVLERAYDEYIIFSKVDNNGTADSSDDKTKYYYLGNVADELVEIGSVARYAQDHFIVSVRKDNGTPDDTTDDTTVYEMYNVNNQKVATFDQNVTSITEMDGGVYKVMLSDTTLVYVK